MKMLRFWGINCCLWLLLTPCLVSADVISEREEPVTWEADASRMVMAEGRVIRVVLSGNVTFWREDMVLKAEAADYLPRERVVHLFGRTRLFFPGGEISGEGGRYNLADGTGVVTDADFSFPHDAPPLFGKAEQVEILGQDEFLLREGYITTCDHIPPHTRIRFPSAHLQAQKQMRFRHPTFLAGNTPLFYLPGYTQALAEGERQLTYSLSPAYRSAEGFQAFATVKHRKDGDLYTYNLDYHGRRGLGGGPEWRTDRWGDTRIATYFIRDRREDADRHRVEAWHRTEFSRGGRGTDILLAEAHKFSDEHVQPDFFWSESKGELERPSFLFYGLNRKDHYTGILASGDLDDFHNNVQRLPEFTFDIPYRRGLGALYWKDGLAFSRLGRRFAGEWQDTERLHLTREAAFFHPFAGGLIRPFVAGGLTHYTRDRDQDETTRFLSQGGFNLGWKFGRAWGDLEQGAHRRHYLEPRVGFTARSVTAEPDSLHPYDRLDRLDSDRFITLQLLNRLQFARNEQLFEALRFDLQTDYSLKREEFSELRGLLDYTPRRNWTLRSEVAYGLPEREWLTIFNTASWRKDRFSCGVSHAFQRQMNDIITSSVSFPLGEQNQLTVTSDYDLRADRFGGKTASLWRDLHCWEGRLMVYHDQVETAVYLQLSPKFFASPPFRGWIPVWSGLR